MTPEEEKQLADEAKRLFSGRVEFLPVSYTHLTLPTSDLV